ncbi:MAG: fructose-1,6-bisphosphatase [Bdellovibrionales bacterium]|jgi:fructose-1,6-bisphosphatase-3|nr:fructose-1,6-bisphosphatase [Bdellovibrionales bacterium]
MDLHLGPHSYRDYCVKKHSDKDVLSLINRKMLIHKQLERPPRSYVVYSDLHGSYEKFLHWLKNGLGFFKISIEKTLGEKFDGEILKEFERLLLIVNKTRFQHVEEFIESKVQNYNPKDLFSDPVSEKFIESLGLLEKYGLSKREIFLSLIDLLKEVTRGDERRIIKTIPTEYLENILKLYSGEEKECFNGLMEGITSDENVFWIMSSLMVKIILVNIFDKHINLGDTYDRGDGADKLIKIYRNYFGENNYSAPLHYIWGNHDILWMGAGLGHPALIMTALRISMRYNNLDFLARYGFKLDNLKKYADETYSITPLNYNYVKAKSFTGWSQEEAIKMTKVLFVLESKLTYQWLKLTAKKGDAFGLHQELIRYKGLLDLFPDNLDEDEQQWKDYLSKNNLLTDPYFPTLNRDKDYELTSEEKVLADELINQFTSLPLLKDDLKWLFEKGEAYRVVDTTLYFHAAIPATIEKGLDTVDGRKGKDLLDDIQINIKKIGRKYYDGEQLESHEIMYFWFLWCGQKSIFFCKEKMATIERTIFNKETASKNDLTTHKEAPNPFYKNVRDDEFLKRVLSEFHAEKVCMGHTPVKTLNQTLLSQTMPAFVIDGGASSAYGDKGAVLINTPEKSFVTFHPSLEDLVKAEQDNITPDFTTIMVEEKTKKKLRHMDKGHFLKIELEAIDQLLEEKMPQFRKKYFV